MSDEAIQLTNNDASSFKSYAVHQGYWKDPYIKYFSPIASTSNLHSQVPHFANEHKPPEMSRGYFARISSMRTTILKFLQKYAQPTGPSACQIVNLGAGYDTMFFNLSDSNNLPLKYVEVDFLRVVSSKIRLIRSKKVLAERVCPTNVKAKDLVITDIADTVVNNETAPGLFKLPTTTINSSLISIAPGKDLITDKYCLVSVDLRSIEDLEKKLDECKLDRSLPTLFITECVLVYMSTEYSALLLKHMNNSFKQCCFLNYEMVNLSDKFGEIMLYNMQQRACKLAGSDVCASIDSQLTRFGKAGFKIVQCITLTDFYLNRLEKAERERIEGLEFLDEKELLIQLLDHYCVCVAGNFPGAKDILFE